MMVIWKSGCARTTGDALSRRRLLASPSGRGWPRFLMNPRSHPLRLNTSRASIVYSAILPARHHRLFVGASALVAALAVVLLAVAIFGFFALAPRKASSPVIVLDRSKITLVSISMLSTSEGWAVGMTNGNTLQGIILHYHQGSWWQVDAPAGAGALRSVFMLSATDGWIVGDKGTILHYTGGRWVQVRSPVTTDLGSVFMSSTTDGWAAGDALLHYHNGAWTD